jgi:hypothetical protein
MYLMMRHAFDLGYRRYEWKCNALNLPSRRAAERLGFLFEGLFRQSMVIKGRNRDTAWYSILDSEWPAVRQVLEQWLAAENFDAAGRQRQALSRLMSDWRSEMVTVTREFALQRFRRMGVAGTMGCFCRFLVDR